MNTKLLMVCAVLLCVQLARVQSHPRPWGFLQPREYGYDQNDDSDEDENNDVGTTANNEAGVGDVFDTAIDSMIDVVDTVFEPKFPDVVYPSRNEPAGNEDDDEDE
jgi:hypothetical protein